jgi:hypothetical protein
VGPDRTRRDRQFEDTVGKWVGAGVAAFLAYNVWPQSLGGLIGFLAAALPSQMGFDDRADRRWWRVLAGWSIAAALALGAAYVLVALRLGAEVEWRRFDRNWGPGEHSLSAWLDHPWAWLPLAAAAAFLVFGIATLLRAR